MIDLSALDVSILGPAFVAGLLVLATHVPMGMQVLDRGIVFIDLAIAQIAGLGVIAADFMGWEPQGLMVQVAAVAAALAGALLLTFTERRAGRHQEALIGVLFVLAASGGLLLLASNPHGGEHLKDLLVGQILWVSPKQIGWLAVLTAVLLVLWFGGASKRGSFVFYALFSIAVTASVQVVGVYLVFSSLIIPALATRELSGTPRLLAAWALGAVGYALGLAASAVFDLPSGAVVVWVLAVAAVMLAMLVRPRTADVAPALLTEIR